MAGRNALARHRAVTAPLFDLASRNGYGTMGGRLCTIDASRPDEEIEGGKRVTRILATEWCRKEKCRDGRHGVRYHLIWGRGLYAST